MRNCWRRTRLTLIATGFAAAVIQAQEPATPVPPPPVQAEIWMTDDELDVTQSVGVAIAFVNRSDGDVTLQSVHLSLAGFRHAGTCWLAGQPLCGPHGMLTLPYPLPRGSAVVVRGDLRRVPEIAGVTRIGGTYSWVDGAGGQRSGILVPATVRIQGFRPFGLSRERLDFLKDLILPVTLVALAWFLQRMQQGRTERQVVLSAMLNKIHQNAERHYMPVSTAMGVFALEIDKLRPWTRREPLAFDKAMLQMLLVFRRMRQLTRKIGGFYFKSRSGERMASRSWEFFYYSARELMNVQALDAVLEQMDVFESTATLAEKRRDAAFEAHYLAIRSGLIAWTATTLEAALKSLEMCRVVIETETNRPFEQWYGRPEEVPEQELRDLITALEQLTGPEKQKAEAIKRLRLALDGYLDEIRVA